MAAESTPNNPGGDPTNPFNFDPEVVALMSNLSQNMEAAQAAVTSAELAVAGSETGAVANATELAAIEGLTNIVRQPNGALADAEDIITGELNRSVREALAPILFATALEVVRQAAKDMPSIFDGPAGYRQQATKGRAARMQGEQGLAARGESAIGFSAGTRGGKTYRRRKSLGDRPELPDQSNDQPDQPES